MPRLASSNSCFTCRRRKIKCDEAVPICKRCSRAGYDCDRSSRLTFKRVTTRSEAAVPDEPRIHLREPHIAELFHLYLKELAPWYDLNDETCAFAKEAGTRALNDMLLFSAIIALAACYSARKLSSSLAVAETYHDRSLRMLIQLCPTDEAVKNGTALATTCLLRSYEIMSEDTDPDRHLFGASTLLSSEVPNLQDASLLASGFWNFLREDITHSLIHSCPLKIKAEQPPKGVITAGNVSNVITLFVARAINIYFNKPRDTQTLQSLEQDIDACWHKYQPVPFAYHHQDSDALPIIKMLSDTDVAACHYHKIVKCILPTGERSDLAAEICGLAMSSLSVAVIVNAYGPICFAGRWIKKVSQRNQLIKWLHDSQRRTAWNVKYITGRLRNSWEEEDNKVPAPIA